ncbi:dipeptidase [Sciscionella sediminilitoris]|uniref:dipeptidase n=1 Tax=Sciscionella sediminilitoris TaxID=1445613 RepID=UPI00068C9BDC|nr:dipeptidase [Sciscionella sp. SE31]
MPQSAIDNSVQAGENGTGSEVLRVTPLVDGHNDLPWALREMFGPDAATRLGELDLDTDLRQAHPELHTDLVRAAEGGLGAQFWSVYVPCSYTGSSAVTAVLQQIELAHAMVRRYPDRLGLATTAAEAREVFASGRLASLLGAEGGHCIDDSLTVLRALYRLGVRYMTLTHNENTNWADSATDEPAHGGLTEFGRRVVAEMNALGMLVDLSHVAESTMRAALEVSSAPVIFSHSCAKAVTDSPRNVPDDVLTTMAGNGGVCMVSFVPGFVSKKIAAWDEQVRAAMDAAGDRYVDLGRRSAFIETWDGPPRPQATLEDVLEHLDHVREVAGIEHIGLGGDYDGVAAQPRGLEDVTGYRLLFDTLAERGWSRTDLGKLAGENALRVLADAESTASR